MSTPQSLIAYAPFVSPGSYMIVEDTDVNGRPILPDYGPGPAEAVEEFLSLPEGRGFVVDHSREKFLFSANKGGYLKKVGIRPEMDS